MFLQYYRWSFRPRISSIHFCWIRISFNGKISAILKTEKTIKRSIHFLSALSAPARRALENNGISTLEQLSNYSKKEVLKFHGMGKSSIPKLEKLLSDQNMSFRLSWTLIEEYYLWNHERKYWGYSLFKGPKPSVLRGDWTSPKVHFNRRSKLKGKYKMEWS